MYFTVARVTYWAWELPDAFHKVLVGLTITSKEFSQHRNALKRIEIVQPAECNTELPLVCAM